MTRLLTRTRAAIDLASIMVGVIIIGVIAGALAATVFAVIPWSQDEAAKSQLKEVVSAEAAHRGLDVASHAYGNYQSLVTAGLLKDNIPSLCVAKTAGGWSAATKSSTTNVYTLSSANPDPKPGVAADYTACASNTGAVSAAEAAGLDPTKMRFTVNTALLSKGATGGSCQSFVIPLGGTVHATVDWGDGTAPQVMNSGYAAHNYAGTQLYNVVVDGTFTTYGANVSAGVIFDMATTGCITEVTHWGSGTGTTTTYGAYQYFQGVTGLVQPPKSVTVYADMFYGSKTFNQPIESWDMSSVTSMQDMFWGAKAFNQPLNNWDVSHVTNMSLAFRSAVAFNQPLDKWNTSSALTMDQMFSMFGSPGVFNQNLSGWNVTNVTAKNAFNNAGIITAPNMPGGWPVGV